MALVEFVCSYCEEVKLLERKEANRRKFCSRKCSSKSQSQRVSVACDTCGENIVRKPSDIKENNFCDKECHNEFMRGATYRIKEYHKFNCLNCNEEVELQPSKYKRNGKDRKFCSKECSYDYHRKNFVSSEVKVECDNCKKTIYRTKGHIKERNYCSYECMGEHYSKEGLFSGENSGTWSGGKKNYYGENWRDMRRKCRERDNYICQDCGVEEHDYGMELSVHHLIPFTIFDNYKEANKLDNLISLCEPCHRIRHSGDNHHTKFSQTYKNIG